MSNQFIGNYSPDDFSIILSKGDFVHKITGFADGTFISMERIIPTSEPYQGVGDNAFARTKRKITSMNVTISLHQASPSNLVLQKLQDADAADPQSNEWVFNCTIKDLSGQTVMSTANAIIMAPATAAFSTSIETRDWGIFMFGTDLQIGGNMPLSEQEVSAVEALGYSVDERWKVTNN